MTSKRFYSSFFLSFTYFISFLFVLGCFRFKEEDSSQTTKVKKRLILERVTLSGSVQPKRKMLIMAPYDGYVQKLFVKIGDKISSGDKLVTLTPSLVKLDNLFPLRASYPGTVVEIILGEGAYIRQNAMILRVDDLSHMFVQTFIPERDILKIKKNQSVLIKSKALLNKTYQGLIQDISLSAKDEPRKDQPKYRARIDILDEDSFLKSDMSVLLDIITKQKKTLALPHEFIRKAEEKNFVRLINNKEREIKIGLQNELWVEVLNLEEGTEVKGLNFYEDFP